MEFGSNLAFQAVSLAVLGLWCRMVYHYRWQMAKGLGNAANFSSAEGPGAAGGGNKQLYEGFLATALVLGALGVGIAAVRVASMFGAPAELSIPGVGVIQAGVLPLLALVAAGLAALLVVLAQVGILRIAGSLTFSGEFADSIVRAKKTYLAAAAVICIPLVLMVSGENPIRDRVVMYAIGAVLVIVAVGFAVDTLRLFINQKVSLLVWFLYLCTVEIFPVGLIVLPAVKNI